MARKLEVLIRLDPPERKKLDKLAKEYKVSLSEVVRMLIKEKQ